jgi:hypothetical protein
VGAFDFGVGALFRYQKREEIESYGYYNFHSRCFRDDDGRWRMFSDNDGFVCV